MASNKDMRRADLGKLKIYGLVSSHLRSLANSQSTAIPYVDPPKSASDADVTSTNYIIYVAAIDTIGTEVDEGLP